MNMITQQFHYVILTGQPDMPFPRLQLTKAINGSDKGLAPFLVITCTNDGQVNRHIHAWLGGLKDWNLFAWKARNYLTNTMEVYDPARLCAILLT